MASAGVVVARAQLSMAGIEPVTQARVVVAGEGAQTASLLRAHQVDALSQFDTRDHRRPRLRYGQPRSRHRILYEVYPQTKPIGKDEETAVADDTRVLRARMAHWDLASGGVTKWDQTNITNFNNYIDFLVKWKLVPVKVPADEVVTNDLVDAINASFDQAKIEAQAKAWKR